MVEVENIINQFNPISLNEMDCVKLLDRVDTKYVCSIFKLSIKATSAKARSKTYET